MLLRYSESLVVVYNVWLCSRPTVSHDLNRSQTKKRCFFRFEAFCKGHSSQSTTLLLCARVCVWVIRLKNDEKQWGIFNSIFEQQLCLFVVHMPSPIREEAKRNQMCGLFCAFCRCTPMGQVYRQNETRTLL
jgi:hypothetical protein